jgi:tetratricopeptide (TPR) repeat protein
MSDRPDAATSRLAVSIAVVSVLIAGVAYLQADAGARDDRANRDSKRYATEALGRNIAGDAQTNFDYYTAFAAWSELGQLADFAEAQGDPRSKTRYETMRDRVAKVSPMLAPPYLDPEKGEVDTNRWEAERYIEDVTALGEKFIAASNVKDAWDYKANTYIVHLTLMAAALALLGLSTTVPGPQTRMIISSTGALLTGIAVVWAAATAMKAVPDLRDKKGAIEAYAKGAGLMHQEKYQEAVQEFGKALQAAPDYARAYSQRAEAYRLLDKRTEAVQDFEKARELGEGSGASMGMLAWIYYEQGRFEDAIAMNQKALEVTPDELWVRFDLGVAQLAAGKKDEALATFKAAADAAAKTVADAKAAGKEAPSVVWYGVDGAVESLIGLSEAVAGDAEMPPKAKIVNPAAASEAADKLAADLSGLAISLEYFGKPSEGASTAVIENIRFAPVDTNGKVGEEGEEFPDDAHNVALRFDFKGMKDGDHIVFKVYYNSDEAAEWRIVEPWSHGAEGDLEMMVAADGGDFTAGDYKIVGFVNGHFAMSGTFSIAESK